MQQDHDALRQLYERCPAPVRAASRQFEFSPGDTIIEQGAVDEFVYILTKGTAKACHTTESGTTLNLYMYQSWEIFGELETFKKRENSCSIVAISDCEAIQLPEKSFFEWLKSDFPFSLYLMERLAEKTLNLGNMAFVNVAYPLEYRLLYFLLNGFQSSPPIGAPTKELLCETLGTNMRSLNRIISGLTRKGILSYKNGVLTTVSTAVLVSEIEKYHDRLC